MGNAERIKLLAEDIREYFHIHAHVGHKGF